MMWPCTLAIKPETIWLYASRLRHSPHSEQPYSRVIRRTLRFPCSKGIPPDFIADQADVIYAL